MKKLNKTGVAAFPDHVVPVDVSVSFFLGQCTSNVFTFHLVEQPHSISYQNLYEEIVYLYSVT